MKCLFTSLVGTMNKCACSKPPIIHDIVMLAKHFIESKIDNIKNIKKH